MYFMAMVLNTIFLKKNYITIIMLTSIPWSLLLFFFFPKQTNIVSFTTMGFFLSLL
jgi:hypothetical protein